MHAQMQEARMANTAVIDVGKDFSTTPGGRYRSEGAWSGEEFRQTLVEPRLRAGENVVVDLDSPVGFTTSFLEEVFGGLVRVFGPGVKDRVRIRATTKPTRAGKAVMYMNRAIDSYSR